MKKAIPLLLLTLCVMGPLAAAHPVFAPHSKEVKPAVDAISTLPEARPLLKKVGQDGRVSVRSTNRLGSKFSAFWDGGRREICVPNAARKSKGTLISSIVFELHNAKASHELAALDKQAVSGKISKTAYVEGIERIEHRNALEASALIEKGVRSGVFPKSARWGMPQDFDTYFRIQKRSGHSGWIAHKYDGMQPIASARRA